MTDTPRILILEGPDAGGKSALAMALAERGYATRHTGPPGMTPPYIQYTGALARAVTANRAGLDPRPFVFDRLHLGERVYGPVLRDRDQLGPILNRHIDRILFGIGGIVLYCTTDFATMEETWRARASKGEELIKDVSRYMALFTRYEELVAGHPLTVRYNYKQHSIDDVLQLVHPCPNPGPGIGAWRPHESILMVGERIAENLHGVDWPFTGMLGSSYWMTTQLQEHGYPEERFYWVNAFKPDTTPQNPAFIDELHPRLVIALGSVAKKWLTDAGVEHVHVEHPQYWKRFRAKDPYPLLEVLSHAR